MILFSKCRFNLLAVFVALVASAAQLSRAAEEIIRTDIGPIATGFQGIPRHTFGVTMIYRSVQGQFDPYGDYTATPDGTSVSMLTTLFSENYNFSEHWGQSAMIPLNHTVMTTPTGASNLYSFGSPPVDARYHFLKWHHLSVHLGTSIPIHTHWGDKNGEPTAAASLQNDMGSVGARGPDVHTGFGVWDFISKFKVSFQGSVAYPFAQTVTQNDIPDGPSMQIQRGITYQIGEGASLLLHRRWSFNLGLKQMWGMESVVDGQVADGTASRLFMTSAGISYAANRSWRVSMGYETPWPFYSFIVNQAYAPSVSAGVFYAAF